MRPHGRARVSSRNPRAFAVCDRCNFLVNHINLEWQYDWAGASLINKRILVCDECNDTPQTQLRAIVVPADPTPILNARVQDYQTAETNTRATSGQNTTDARTGLPVVNGDTRITQNNLDRVTQQTGEPAPGLNRQPGLDQNAVMPFQTQETTTSAYYVALNLLSVISNGLGTITVTCSTAHGLSTGDQISVNGLSTAEANGFYSVTVTSGTAFTYLANPIISAGGLLTNTTKMVTANAGLPYNSGQVPQTGPLG